MSPSSSSNSPNDESPITYITSSGGYYGNTNTGIDLNSEGEIHLTETNHNKVQLSQDAVIVSSPSSPSTPSPLHDFNSPERISSYFPSSSTTNSPITKGEMYLPPAIGASQTFSSELPTLLSNYGTYSDDISASTETNTDFTASGISHIANTLLNQHNDQSNVEFSHSDISHPGAESVLIESNEPELGSYGGFSTPSFASTSSGSGSSSSSTTEKRTEDETTTPRIVKITYSKPQFKPKPKPTQPSLNDGDKYVLVHTISNDKTQVSNKPDATISDNDIESIESIILMLNDTGSGSQYETATGSGGSSYNSVTPTYGTRKPSPSTTNEAPTSFYITTKLPSSTVTNRPPSTSYLYTSTPTHRPGSQPVLSDNGEEDEKFTLISSTINSIKFPSSTLQPPSTSYLYTSTPTKRPTSGDTVIINTSTYGGFPTSTSTKKPSTSFVYSSSPITRRPTTPATSATSSSSSSASYATTISDEVIITPTTKRPTITTKKGTKRPATGTTVKRPNSGTKRPKPAKTTTLKPVTQSDSTKRPATSGGQPNRKTTASTTTTTTRPSELPQSTFQDEYTNDKLESFGQLPIEEEDNSGYGQVSLGTNRPLPTVHITPKPTVNVITSSSWTQRPSVNKFTVPNQPPSTSYIYSSVPVTQRPGYYSTTPNYPPIHNDFDDSGYFGVTIRPAVEHTVTATSIYTVVENGNNVNSYGQPIPGGQYGGQSSPGYGGGLSSPAYGSPSSPGYGSPSSPAYGSPSSPAYGSPSSPAYGSGPSSASYGGNVIYQSTPSYPAFSTIKDEFQSSPDDLISFPPVRNPNLNVSGNYGDDHVSTPAFMEDDALDDKMSILVNKIVASFQGNFDNLADMVYDRNQSTIEQIGNDPVVNSASSSASPSSSSSQRPTSSKKPTKKPGQGSARPGTAASTSASSSSPSSSKPSKPSKAPTSPKPVTTKKPRPTTTRKPARKPTTSSSSSSDSSSATKKPARVSVIDRRRKRLSED